jgi:hypothetical protein
MIYTIPDPARDLPGLGALLGRRNEHGSVNFTSFAPTSRYPVGLSTKTKELHSEDAVSPEVHLAAWQSAQWHFLYQTAGDNIEELGFLPGIIIEGHDWKFVVTTWDNGSTVRVSTNLVTQ